MKNFALPIAVIAILAAPAALSHSGVKDPQVMARMQLMSLVAADMKILGGMAKGSIGFDLERVKARAGSLEQHAVETLQLFEPQANDPKSEARPAIWEDWDGFSAKANEMQQAAKQLGLVTAEDGFEAAFRVVGQTCTACHETYRIEKN